MKNECYDVATMEDWDKYTETKEKFIMILSPAVKKTNFNIKHIVQSFPLKLPKCLIINYRHLDDEYLQFHLNLRYHINVLSLYIYCDENKKMIFRRGGSMPDELIKFFNELLKHQ